ncbi:hypothetical protein ACPF0S_09845 [Leuconostoc suionicum]|uniref:hypothetical protein n=1 Tax=Leuconostoc suionicum TaxID=1511761 RepID=UPI003C510B47
MRHYFKVRSHPLELDLYQSFLDKQIVAIGYPEITVNENQPKTDIIADVERQLMEKYNYSGQGLRLRVGYFKRLLSMKVGDIILLPHQNKEIAIVEVTGGYHFENGYRNQHMSNQVDIKLIKKLSISTLSERLRRSIGVILSISSLDNHSDEIDRLIVSDVNNDYLVAQESNSVLTNNDTYSFEQNVNRNKIKIEFDTTVTKEELETFFLHVTRLVDGSNVNLT